MMTLFHVDVRHHSLALGMNKIVLRNQNLSRLVELWTPSFSYKLFIQTSRKHQEKQQSYASIAEDRHQWQTLLLFHRIALFR